jgi:hypothetical protein
MEEVVKAMLAEMNANMKSNQERAEANRKADQYLLARMESQIGSLVSRLEAHRKAYGEKLAAVFGADREERTARQEATEVFPEKIEPKHGERRP